MPSPSAQHDGAEPEYADALPDGAVRGRGAALNPGNRFVGSDPKRGVIRRLHVLGEHLDEVHRARTSGDGDACPAAPQVRTEVRPDSTRRIINRVDSPDISFNWSINPYRGCEHGCIYCYARPDHERLGYSSGLDFETKLVAKVDAPRLLRRELAHPKWTGETIVFSGVTDCYQPIEREYRITRGCLEVIADCRQPLGIITKNKLVLRDLDLLQELARHKAVRVGLSVTTLDNRLASRMEPRASSPSERLETLAALHDAGIQTFAMIAPIIPGLNDREIPALLKAVSQAGAQTAGYILLRLPHQIKALFLDWLARCYPERANHVESLMRQVRGGALYDPAFGVRQRGRGPIAAQINSLFDAFSKRCGLDGTLAPLNGAAFRRPAGAEEPNLSAGRMMQLSLFGQAAPPQATDPGRRDALPAR